MIVTIIIFYSGCCGKIRYDYMQEIKESGCEFRVIKLKGGGKNALDFCIAAECGIVSERGEKQIAIISNDKGFQAVIDFFGADQSAKKVQVVKAGNIENALTLFHAPEDVDRRRLLQNRKSLILSEPKETRGKRLCIQARFTNLAEKTGGRFINY